MSLSLSIYIYTYTYIGIFLINKYIYIYIHLCMCIYIYAYIYIYIHIAISIYIYTYVYNNLYGLTWKHIQLIVCTLSFFFFYRGLYFCKKWSCPHRLPQGGQRRIQRKVSGPRQQGPFSTYNST